MPVGPYPRLFGRRCTLVPLDVRREPLRHERLREAGRRDGEVRSQVTHAGHGEQKRRRWPDRRVLADEPPDLGVDLLDARFEVGQCVLGDPQRQRRLDHLAPEHPAPPWRAGERAALGTGLADELLAHREQRLDLLHPTSVGWTTASDGLHGRSSGRVLDGEAVTTSVEPVAERLAVDAGGLHADEGVLGGRTVPGEPGGERVEPVGVVGEGDGSSDQTGRTGGEGDGERLGGDVDAEEEARRCWREGCVHRGRG